MFAREKGFLATNNTKGEITNRLRHPEARLSCTGSPRRSPQGGAASRGTKGEGNGRIQPRILILADSSNRVDRHSLSAVGRRERRSRSRRNQKSRRPIFARSCTGIGAPRSSTRNPEVLRHGVFEVKMKTRTRKLVVFLLVAVTTGLAGTVWAQEQTWKINIKNADIHEFVTQVAEITGKTFVIDPRLKGNVTVISSTSTGAPQRGQRPW